MDETANDNPKPKPRRGPSALSADDALAVLGAALNHVHTAGLMVNATNDDAMGALVIQIGGARLDKQDGKTRFTARAVGQPTASPTEPV